MRRTAKRQMTIERHTVTIIRTKGQPLSVFCQNCQKLITDLIPEQVVLNSQTAVNKVDQPFESDGFHLIEAEDGGE